MRHHAYQTSEVCAGRVLIERLYLCPVVFSIRSFDDVMLTFLRFLK